MTFEDFCKAKFDKGHLEHNEPWDAEHIDARKEIKNELADLYNYAELLADKVLATKVRSLARLLWLQIDSTPQGQVE